jgi:RHS repeat-associated protein
MLAWTRSTYGQMVATFLAATVASSAGCGGGGGEETAARTGSRRAGLTDAPPSAPPPTAANEQQGNFADPPTNAGAFVQQIPIEVPPGIGAMTPQLSLAYSSHGGLGVAGVGWDMPMPMITINQADGLRPATVEDDIMRYPIGTPVERYSSNFGTIAQLRQAGPYPTAPKTYVFTAHNDARIDPLRDEPALNQEEYAGEKAAWLVTTKDGTAYRYGYLDDSSLWRDEGQATRTKVGWLLDQVEDIHGNRMHYYYEEYPGGQDTFRQPSLRAIEYGVPASNQTIPLRTVVLFNYIESPNWKKTTYTLGTATDFAYVLDEVCVYTKSGVVAGTTSGGHRTWSVPGPGPGQPDDAHTNVGCWELTYQFEDSAYPAGYTGRPLLMKVQRVAGDGTSRLPPWTFTYRHQSTLWQNVYQASVDAGGTEWDVPDEASLERATLDVEQQMMDVNGDGLADILEGQSNGQMAVSLAQPDDDGLSYAAPVNWTNPLLGNASSVNLIATMGDNDKNSGDSDIWHHFTATVAWEAGAGLGFARTLTTAPDPLYKIFLDHVPGTSGEWDEAVDEHLTLGMFQFLHSSFVGPPPSIGMRNLVDRADTIDQLETIGSFKDKQENEAGFDSRGSDGQDVGNNVELDHCFATGSVAVTGALGADLACFEPAGARWFAAAHATDGKERGFAAETWAIQDMDGDGLVDLVFAAPVMVRTASGAIRNFLDGANDWFISPGNGSGFGRPRPWIVPSKSPPLLEVGVVQGTPMLGVTVSDNELQANRVYGGGAMLNVGATGWSVSPTVILPGGAVGLPSFGTGWDGGFDPKSFAVNAGISAGFQAAAYAGVGQRALSAAALSLRAVSAMIDPLAGLPTVGFGMNLTNKGPSVTFDLPYLGQLTISPSNDAKLARSYGYQGMVDLTGDGRPDLVSSRFETPFLGLNPASQWLLYRNNGTGFEEPEVIRFAESPITAAGATIGPPPVFINSMSRSTTLHYTDTLAWQPDGWQDFPIGVLEQDWGLADLNGDGYPDLVDSTNQACAQAVGPTENCWTVYFNLGREFSEAIEWRFKGNWQTAHGAECNGGVLGFPRIMRTTYGQVVQGNNADPRLVQSRQVQGLADVNGDGLMDFVYEKPAPVDGPGSQCDYINPSSNFSNESDIGGRVSPYTLHRKLLVRLNTGNGFGDAIDWVDGDGYALAGAYVVGGRQQDPPQSAVSHASLGAGDFDGDGAPDLSVRLDADWYEPGDQFELSKLYKLGEANVDVMDVVTTPNGGRIEVAYDYEKASAHMAGGHWVVSSLRMADLDQTRLDVTRHYYYEGGKYDRTHRTFQGFERVYQVSETTGDRTSTGYTLSRYYQSPGFEGQPYCRAVRRLDDAKDEVAELVAEHREEWDATPLGGARPGWTAPVAIGDAEHATALAGPLGLPSDDADLAGGPDAPEGSPGSYGPPPTGTPTDDPAEEAAEEERDEVDEATTPEPEEPVWPPDDLADVTSALGVRPIDVVMPGQGIVWRPENDAPQPNWWDIPLYGDECEPGSTGSMTFACEPNDISLPSLACGDSDDPGTLVQEEFSIAGDLSTVTGIHAIRPVVASTRLYDAVGANPRITASDRTYDSFGAVTTQRDLGDIAITTDDAITTSAFTDRGDFDQLIDKPCEVTARDAAGQILRQTRYAYDGAGFGCGSGVMVGDVTSVKRSVAAGHSVTESYVFTAEGLISTHTDPRQHVTTTTYDPFFVWFPIREERTVFNVSGLTTIAIERRWLGVNQGSTTHFGLLAEEVDANGDLTTHTYDGFDRPLKLVRPGDTIGAPTERWVYRDRGAAPNSRTRIEHTRRFSAALSVTTTTTYDGFGLVQKVEGPPPENLAGCGAGCLAVADEDTYDAEGRVTVSRHAHFSNDPSVPDETRTTYDLLGRITRATGPNGHSTTTSYDRDLTTTSDPDGLVTVTRIDARGKTTGVYRYADSGASLYSGLEHTYRPDGPLSTIVDDAGNTWSFQHDWLGRQTSASDPNTGTRNTIYDDDGNAAIVTDGRFATLGLAMGTLYDALDRPTLREVRRGTTVSGTTLSGGTPTERTLYWYDVDPALFPDAVMACAHNNLGHLSRVVQWLDLGGVLTEVSRKEYCYDDRGRVQKMAHIIGGQEYDFAYTYGSANQIVEHYFPDGDIVTYEYDASGRVARTRNLAGPLLAESHARADGMPVRRQLGSGAARQRFCYDDGPTGPALSRMVVGSPAMGFACGNTPAPAAGAIYDVSYLRTNGGRIEERSETFVRPTTGPETTVTSYDYDGVFRLEKETYDGAESDFDYDTLDNLTMIGGETQDFGDAGRAVRGAGPNAILEGADGRTFAYDAVGNAVSMTTGGLLSAFPRAFDGQPLGVLRGTNPNDWSMYHYDEAGNRVLRAKGGVGKIYAGPYHDTLGHTETMYPGLGVKSDSAQYFTVGDPAGSTALVIDAAGNPVQYTTYEAYGAIRSNDTFDPAPADGLTPYQTDYLFGGKERDPTFAADDDLYDFGPRMYFADVGTWIQADPSYDDGPNRYTYVHGDPINRADPTGKAGGGVASGLVMPPPFRITLPLPDESLLRQLPNAPGVYMFENGNLRYVGMSSWSVRYRLWSAFWGNHPTALAFFETPGTKVTFWQTYTGGDIPRWIETHILHSEMRNPGVGITNRALNPMIAESVVILDEELGHYSRQVVASSKITPARGTWLRMGFGFATSSLGMMGWYLNVRGSYDVYQETLQETGSHAEAAAKTIDMLLMPFMPFIIIPAMRDPNGIPSSPPA